ncbi:MAG: S8 family serine peptidase, partial [Candidatus Thermoplasmatota archaeon]
MRKRIVITVASVLALLLNVNAITIMETTDASESTGQGVKSESLSASEFPVAAGSQKPEYASGELVIKFKSEIAEAITKAVTTGNFRVIPEAHSIGVLNSKYEVNSMERVFETSSDPKLQNIYLLNFFAEVDPMLVAYEYSQELNVEYAEPNYKVQIFALPNDTYIDPDQDGNWSEGAWGQEYEDMWGLKKIGMEKAWGIGKESKSAIVAVIDTGVDYSHEDLAPDNIWQNLKEDADGDGHTLEYTGERWILDPGDINDFDDDGNGKIDDLIGWDFYNRDNDPLDDHGHGTHCAGTIGAVTNNGVGVAGVARSVKIMALKGLSVDGGGYDDDLAKAINYAADNGADVISMSWGGLGSSIVLSDALNDAYSKGVVLVAAA